MKLITLLIFILFCFIVIASNAQPGELVEISKRYYRVDVPVTDGLIYKYNIGTQQDTARYFNSGNKKFKAEIRFTEITDGTPPVETPSVLGSIDNAIDQRNRYSGEWFPYNNAAFHNSTSSYTLVADNYVEVTFIGKQIEWWSEKAINHGIIGLSIDGGTEVTVDTYANTTINNTQKLWTSPVLPAGTHKLRIRMTGAKNPAATQNNLIHDRVNVIQ